MKTRNWTRHFQQHEIDVLNGFTAALPEKAKVRFADQLDAVGGVQRLAKGADVNVYSRGLLKLKQLDCKPFVGMPEEMHVASLFPVVMNDSCLSANIWFVEGRLFTIEFQGAMAITTPVKWRCDLKVDFTKHVE